MALETASYVADLVESNPAGTDLRTTADDHLRLIKASLKRTFPNADAAVTATPAELNQAVALTPKSLGEDGYFTLPGDVLVQWGQVPGMGGIAGWQNYDLTFDVEFSSTPWVCFVSSKATANPGFSIGGGDEFSLIRMEPPQTGCYDLSAGGVTLYMSGDQLFNSATRSESFNFTWCVFGPAPT